MMHSPPREPWSLHKIGNSWLIPALFVLGFLAGLTAIIVYVAAYDEAITPAPRRSPTRDISTLHDERDSRITVHHVPGGGCVAIFTQGSAVAMTTVPCPAAERSR